MTKRRGQAIQWQKEEDRQYNNKKKRTDNTMTQRRGQTIQ
jgi:hypothetical protein